MKKITIMACLLLASTSFAQPTWQKGGNNAFPAWLPPTIGTNYNSFIQFETNNTIRMSLMQTNPVGSITGSLGLGIVLPNAYLHLSNFGTGVFDPQGRMFRTDGLNSFVNSWSLRTGTTAVNSIERFIIYVPANSSNA